MPSKFQTTMRRDDRIRVQTAGAGGWGDPLEREPVRVADDVREGKISVGTARHEYGVVIDPDTMAVNEYATRALRQGVRGDRAAKAS
jgi:N-methylhydantoinase B